MFGRCASQHEGNGPIRATPDAVAIDNPSVERPPSFASRLYQNGDNPRKGAAIALEGIWRSLMVFEKPLAELLHLPFLHLQDALVGLDQGTVAPLVRPVPRPRGAP